VEQRHTDGKTISTLCGYPGCRSTVEYPVTATTQQIEYTFGFARWVHIGGVDYCPTHKRGPKRKKKTAADA
jgi:hypothetical protein